MQVKMHGIGHARSDAAATGHSRGTRDPEAVGKRFEISALRLYAHVCSGDILAGVKP